MSFLSQVSQASQCLASRRVGGSRWGYVVADVPLHPDFGRSCLPFVVGQRHPRVNLLLPTFRFRGAWFAIAVSLVACVISKELMTTMADGLAGHLKDQWPGTRTTTFSRPCSAVLAWC